MAAQNAFVGDNAGNGDNSGGAGPFGVGAVPGVFQGEVAGGNPQVLGPQFSQQVQT